MVGLLPWDIPLECQVLGWRFTLLTNCADEVAALAPQLYAVVVGKGKPC
jgi:hypothetical protein